MNTPKFSPCLATLLAGLLLALSVNAAHPAHEEGILLLVPLDTEPSEVQVAQATVEVAGKNATDSSAWSSAADQAAADEPPRQSSGQAAWGQVAQATDEESSHHLAASQEWNQIDEHFNSVGSLPGHQLSPAGPAIIGELL